MTSGSAGTELCLVIQTAFLGDVVLTTPCSRRSRSGTGRWTW